MNPLPLVGRGGLSHMKKTVIPGLVPGSQSD
jgi:hypothetical protein